MQVHARVSDCGMVLDSPDTGRAPILSGTCAVYGRVCGDVHLTDTALVISGEEICNDSLDTLVMDGKSRSVIRDSSRDELAPQQRPLPRPKNRKGVNEPMNTLFEQELRDSVWRWDNRP